jgi:hypothetical protein
MTTPGSSSQSRPVGPPTEVAIPKENSPARDPPPAYVAPPQNDHLRSALARLFPNHGSVTLTNLSGPIAPSTNIRRPAAINFHNADRHDPNEDEYEEDFSPICIRVSTAIHIGKDQNMVCLTNTPAEQASSIANAVTSAIHDSSSAQVGIPMIDENGRPRPLKIEVDAGINIDGSLNVIGNQSVINEVIRQRSVILSRKQHRSDEESIEEARARKRTRSLDTGLRSA